ncbi:MAG TPA: DNRLRE domain-containing protein [Blastococcus sp.]|nr:DNRLRE domain-containing protein [Blastococcus sp.]
MRIRSLARNSALTMSAAAVLLLSSALVDPPASVAAADPVIAIGGDVGCPIGVGPSANSCQQAATADVIGSINPAAVLPLGDEQYESGDLASFQQVYGPTWGRFRSISHPIVGNHEYETAGAAGYFGYFGTAAGDAAKGYYSYDLGTWHLIALNSECSQGAQIGCAAGSPQETWLKADLAAHPNQCILAYWHEPRFSSGAGGSNSIYGAFWQDLYAAHADVVFNGHSHVYERFAPQTPTAVADPTNGIREFVVGMGGVNTHDFTAALPNEQARQNTAFGVMKMTLHSSSYDWSFMPIAGSSYSDSGSATCHAQSGAPTDTTPPSVPSGLAAGIVTPSSVPLSWSPSTDEAGGSGLAGYRVYRNGATTPLNPALATSASYTDATAAAGTTYSYAVTAVDKAGNESARSSPVSVTTPAGSGSGTLTFGPTDDAMIDSTNPTVNFGSTARLDADGSPVIDSLLKFTVSGTAGCTVSKAVLRLTVGSSTDDNSDYGGDVYPVTSNSWSESTVTWNTRPASGTTSVGEIGTGAVALNTTYTVDVTPLVQGDGTVSMLLANSNSDGAQYWSKDGSTAAQAPQLQVTCGSSTADTTPPSTPTGLTASGVSSSQVSLGWTASTDNVGVAGYRVYRNGATTPLGSSLVTSRSYTDGTVSPGTTYSYAVTAVDKAGNESARSSPVSVTTPAVGSGTATFTPTDDATIDSSSPSFNAGSSARLDADGSPVVDSLLKFTVTGTAGCTVTKAVLRLTVGSSTYDDSAYGGDVYPVSSNSWSESTVTWNTRPASGTTSVGEIGTGAVALNTTYTADVTSLVTGDGTVSMLLANSNPDAAQYWSKDGSTAAQAPQLQVTCGASGGPDTTAPSVPAGLTAGTVTASSVPLSWSASTDNVGVAGYRVYRNGASTPVNASPVTSTSYTDSAVTAGTTYTYAVSAVDAAGNESARSSPLSVTTPAAGSTTLTFRPTDDATIDESHPTVNAGSASRLVADASPVNDVLLKFAVTGTSGCTVSKAVLRLTVGSSTDDNSDNGGNVYSVTSTTWSESTVTWNTRPTASTTAVARVGTGAVALNTAYTADVTSLVKGDGTVSMQVANPSSDGVRYWSKDGSTAAQAPQLQVTCG